LLVPKCQYVVLLPEPLCTDTTGALLTAALPGSRMEEGFPGAMVHNHLSEFNLRYAR